MEGHTFVACKQFRLGGTEYKPGDPIDVSGLMKHKVSQMLNQRWIRPIDNSPDWPNGLGTVNGEPQQV